VVAHLARLKLRLLANGLRRSPWQVVGLVFALLYAGGGVLLALVGLGALSTQDADLRRTVVVLAGAVLVLGWWLLPVVAFGVDATMEPDRFATFAIPRAQLVAGLAVAGLLGVPGIATTLLALGGALPWWRQPLAVLAALVGAVLGTALCVVGSRATTTVLAPLLARRRFRELATVVVLVPLVLAGPILNALGVVVDRTAQSLPAVADVVAWTPFGAPWALAADVAEGAWARLLGHVAVAVVALALLVLVWARALSRAMVRQRSTSGVRGHAGLGLLGRVPATRLGAVTARCLIYWWRDPRYAVAVVIVPLLPVLLWFLGGGDALLVLGPLTGTLIGWSISADVSYDGTAFWMHVVAPLRGRVDRLGRVASAAAIGLPATLLMVLGGLVSSGRWELTAAMLGLSVGALGSALGAASVLSARIVYPVLPPGSNPFATPQGGTTASMVSQLVGFGALGLLLLPGVVLTLVAAGTRSVPLGLVAAAVALGIGAAVLVLGVGVGGDTLDRRAPALLTSLRAMA